MADKPKAAPKKGFNIILVLIPIAVIAALVLAYSLPPTHALIVNGPLKPVFARFLPPTKSVVASRLATPDPALQIKKLSGDLEGAKQLATAKDARIAQLQSQLNEAQAAPKVTPVPTTKISPAAISEDVKRAGAYWASMDAEKAADVASRLPTDYVQRVFAAMPPDTVAEIMNALPAKTAAALTTGR